MPACRPPAASVPDLPLPHSCARLLPTGGFPIKETEWYFGLRIRHRHQRSRYMNIPVNVTVGPYGGVGWGGEPGLLCILC